MVLYSARFRGANNFCASMHYATALSMCLFVALFMHTLKLYTSVHTNNAIRTCAQCSAGWDEAQNSLSRQKQSEYGDVNCDREDL